MESNVFLHAYPSRLVPRWWVINSLLLVMLLGLSQQTRAQVSGTVFKDFNINGTRENSGLAPEPGVSGVTVRIFNAAGIELANDITDGSGSYTIPSSSVPDGTAVRVEFSTLPTGAFVSKQGGDNGTLTQFVTAPSTSVGLGIITQAEADLYNGSNIFTSCYINGNPVPGTEVGNDPAIVQMGYFNAVETTSANQSQVGAVWGLAFSKSRNRLYEAAVLRRHSGFGPDGVGAIYIQNPDDPSSVATLTTLSAGELTNDNRDLTLAITRTSLNTDGAAFGNVGKDGLGDIDLSLDENTLYITNLTDQKLYSLSLDASGDAIGSATEVGTAPWLSNPCSGGTPRPWGIKVANVNGAERVYVGVVCDASSSQTAADLRASVYEYNVNTNTWNDTPVLEFPLNYARQNPGGQNLFGTTFGWKPWTDSYSAMNDDYNPTTQAGGFQENTGGGGGNYAQPILADIEIDANGDMILGFLDRGGIQFGAQNYPPNGQTTQISYVSGGDILRAGKTAANAWTIEDNGTTTNTQGGSNRTTTMPLSLPDGYVLPQQAGPGGKEFYWGDVFPPANHPETSFGALAILPGVDQVVMTGLDPENTVESGGIIWLSNVTGEKLDGRNLYSPAPGNFAKAVGLGDLEIVSRPVPVNEIGNRIWLDSDGDGVQDAGESGIADLQVQLYKDNVLVGTTTTSALGEYYFNDDNVTDGLEANTAYEIRVATNQDALQNSIVTLTNTGGNDEIDSDASIVGSDAVITVNTGAIVGVNHSYDIGFRPTPASLGDLVFVDVDKDGIQDAGEPGIAGVTVTLYTNGVGSLTTTTNASGLYSFTGLTPGSSQSYAVGFTAHRATRPVRPIKGATMLLIRTLM